MNNTMTPEQAAKKFAAKHLNTGFIFEALHVYYDLHGQIVIFWRIRLKHPNGEKWIRPMHKDAQGEYMLCNPPELQNIPKPLYGQQLISTNITATVVIVEGEKLADTLNKFFAKNNVSHKLIAITSGGATSAEGADWQLLANRKCIIWPDNDDAGLDYAKIVHTKLEQLSCMLEVINISSLNLPIGGDCVDWLEENNYTINDFLAIERVDKFTEDEEPEKEGKSNQATELVAFVLENCDLFHDNNKEVFAINKNSHEVRHIDSRDFRDLTTANYYEHCGKSVRDLSWKEALSTISGIGRHRSECHNVHRRVAKHGESYYLDLCHPGNSKAIEITPGTWNIIDSPPVRFVRSNTMLPLPIPTPGGELSALWQVCNIPEDSQFLTITWLAEILRPDTPFPVLELLGEQGSAKSTTQTALRRIIDPNACDLRAAPNKSEDLFISANLNHIVSCENISHLHPLMQDSLCIIATGGALPKRKIYTDRDESVIYAKNPVILNGIVAAITAQDLIDRSITIELPVITDRIETTNIRAQFESEHGAILGALLDIFVKALTLLPNSKLPASERPRLLEFALLGMAIAEAMGSTGEEFMRQFKASRQESLARTIDSSPVSCAVIDWHEANGRISRELPAKMLLSEIERYRPEHTDAWPRSAKGFADALRRAAPAMRQLGIECRSLGKIGSYVKWRIAPISSTVN